MSETDATDPVAFTAAMEELTSIVNELESDALDVDQLAGRVGRAAELVAMCRDRIDGARFAVEEIVGRLDQQEHLADDPV
jgi:exodeoxyribonuclease VII small subunit